MISRFGGRIKVPVAASRWNHVPRHVRACRLHAGQHGGEKLFSLAPEPLSRRGWSENGKRPLGGRRDLIRFYG
jgi:hypothetical protein